MIHCCILLDFLYELYYDARIHEHQVYEYPSQIIGFETGNDPTFHMRED